MKRLLAVFVTVALLAAGANAHARGEKRGGFLHGRHVKEVLKELNLTEEQKTKIKEIRKSHKEEMKTKRTAVKDSMKGLREMMQTDAGRDQIVAKYASVETARNDLGRSRIGLMLDVREVLTPAQRKQFRELLEKRMKKAHDAEDGE